MKCWNSTFNAQGLKIIIIVVHVGVVKIHITIVDLFKKNERLDEIMCLMHYYAKIGHSRPLIA
jgi:hypothetical protein